VHSELRAQDADQRKRGPYKWSEARLEAELRRLVGKEGRIPSSRDLNRRGQAGLRAAITAQGGFAHWADRLGVTPAPSQDRSPIAEAEAAGHRFGSPITRDKGSQALVAEAPQGLGSNQTVFGND